MSFSFLFKHPYVSIELSYVHKHAVYKRFVGLKHIQSLKGKSVSDVLVEELVRLQIPLKDMIVKGQQHIWKRQWNAAEAYEAGATISPYFHRFVCRLNLVLGKCAETLPILKDVVETIGSVFVVMGGSPKCMAVCEENFKKFSVKEGRTVFCVFSETRWTTRADNLTTTVNNLPALIATLKELKSSEATCEGIVDQNW